MGIIRDLDRLQPELTKRAKAFIDYCKRRGLFIMVLETLRTQQVQDAYYAQSREPLAEVNKKRALAGLYLLKSEKENTLCTNAKVSNHSGGQALDVAPARTESDYTRLIPWWSALVGVWEHMGAIAEYFGLDWCAGGYGQTWGKRWDNPHCEELKSWTGESMDPMDLDVLEMHTQELLRIQGEQCAA